MPPLNIKVRDHRTFGSKPVVGTCVVPSLQKFRVDPVFLGKDLPPKAPTGTTPTPPPHSVLEMEEVKKLYTS